IRLRQQNITQILPDLMVRNVDRYALQTNLQTLEVQGLLVAEVINTGTTNAGANVIASAFYDADNDGIYLAAQDVLLGEQNISINLATDTYAVISIPVKGVLPYRDANISVWVDSGLSMVELDETNNVASTIEMCFTEPESVTFDPVLKWEWTGSSIMPRHNQVMMAPVVVPLEDTNADGKIDENDIPAIVFNSYDIINYNTNGVLRAISGQDGREIWTIPASFKTFPSSHIAAADLDNDGFIEILSLAEDPYITGSTSIIVFDYQGNFLWSTFVGKGLTYYGVLSIADMDADGSPEIIIGNKVFNADGKLKFDSGGYTGTNYVSLTQQSIAADINLDGKMELLAGASAHSSTGQLLWQRSDIGDGFTAVANFNDDPYPEIVVLYPNKLYLLDHYGNTIWGPISLPDRGRGGTATIGDMNGDGKLEIGIASRQSYYLFNSDGSLLWSSSITDTSSNMTGSSAFDFNGDGKVEIVISDEYYLYVLNGIDGSVLFKTVNSNGTIMELPVIADIDVDGHADIVVSANKYRHNSAVNNGIRVFSDRNNSWMPTRSIWNQHSYHITNINDDGSVPQHEQPSWLTHNTFRLNTFMDRNPLASTDLSISQLIIEDQGIYLSPRLKVRIGNAGAAASAANLVSFYEGDPYSGTLLGTVAISPLAVNSYTDIQFDLMQPLSGVTDVYAVVDPFNSLNECSEDNNQVSASPQQFALLASLLVNTDATTYIAGTPVNISNTIQNTGSFVGNFTLDIVIEDMQGNIAFSFSPVLSNTLFSNDMQTINLLWDSNNVLAGDYLLRSVLYDSKGEQALAEILQTISITANTAGAPLMSLHIVTDNISYNVGEQVGIQLQLSNNSSNAFITATSIQLSLVDNYGQPLLNNTYPLSVLTASAIQELFTSFPLNNSGDYNISATVFNNSNIIAQSDSITFNVASQSTMQQITAITTLDTIPLLGAQILTGVDVLTNSANTPSSLIAHQLIVDAYSGNIVAQVQQSIIIPANSSFSLPISSALINIISGQYIAVLQIEQAGISKGISFASFEMQSNNPPAPTASPLLLAEDGYASSQTAVNDAPIANAGLDVYGSVGGLAAIDGYASTDADGDALTYQWSVVSAPVGSVANFADAYAMSPAIIPDIAGDYVLSLRVHDGTVWSAAALLDLHISPPVTQLQASISLANNNRALLWIDDDIATEWQEQLQQLGWEAVIADDMQNEQLRSDAYGLHITDGKELTDGLQAAIERGAGLLHIGDESKVLDIEKDDHGESVSLELDISPISDGGLYVWHDRINVLKSESGKEIGRFILENGHISTALVTSNIGAGRTLVFALDAKVDSDVHQALLADSLVWLRMPTEPYAGRTIPIDVNLAHSGDKAIKANLTLVLPEGVTTETNTALQKAFILDAEQPTQQWRFWITLPDQAGKINLAVQIDGDQAQTLNLDIQVLPSLIEAIITEVDDEESNDGKHNSRNSHSKKDLSSDEKPDTKHGDKQGDKHDK
ncbi:MAG: CARDB domain-containing protein, partial [Mariprofundales bacterium]